VNHQVKVEMPRRFGTLEGQLSQQQVGLRESAKAIEDQSRAIEDQGREILGLKSNDGGTGVSFAEVVGKLETVRSDLQRLSENFSESHQMLMGVNHLVKVATPEQLTSLSQQSSDIHARFNEAHGLLMSVNHVVKVETVEKFFHFENKVKDLRMAIIDLERRVNTRAQQALPQKSTVVSGDESWYEGLYLSFEDRHRGTREEIKRRLAQHLPILESLNFKTDDRNILDLGCGRGEWLELLSENGFSARGCDSNLHMVEACVKMGLTVDHQNLMDCIRTQKDRSVAVISAFHVVEHLPHRVLIELLNECLRVLKPGGAVLFETPNPENLVVGATNFWIDPTHVRPLLPAGLEFLAETRGFEDCQILRINAVPSEEQYPATQRDPLLVNLVYGPRDYALFARKGRLTAGSK
jgi:O-antigen chain-terminating methyltransferase